MAAFYFAAVLFIVADRAIKYGVVNGIISEPKIFGDFFRIDFAKNYQIAFSLPLQGKIVFALIVVVALAFGYYFVSLFKEKRPEAIFAFLVFLGSMSNLMDRINYGFVVDYLYLKYFTVFNLADVAIVIGVAGLLFSWRRVDKK